MVTNDASGPDLDTEVEVLIIGAGVTGIYQLYLAREAGYSVQMLEQGTGVGGTWYWNRYPGCRYDSESYTYGYFFSEELFREWEWSERFAGQPENERYFNHVVDKFDLRRHIRFGTKVTSVAWDEAAASYLVEAPGYRARARYVVAATGVLSVPFYPSVPGRELFRGESYHTGLWPKTPVDFKGKRVAVIGTGSSGVQVIPIIAPEVASLTVYQRTPNWATPVNNAPITPQEQADLNVRFEEIRDTVATSVSGFLHVPSDKYTFSDSAEERQEFYEKVWATTGFGKLITNYRDMMLDPAANAEWSKFVADKIRAMVDDPAIAAKLIPTDHSYGGKRPPFVTDYYQAYNRPNVSLVDLNETPITAITETGIGTADGLQEFDIIVWATGFDFGTGALNRLGVRGRPAA
jgi:cation diffusion facilitator CzcD-associated flavoprotein CzcO